MRRGDHRGRHPVRRSDVREARRRDHPGIDDVDPLGGECPRRAGACASIGPEQRGCPDSSKIAEPRRGWRAAARPSASTSSGVRSWFAVPRRPSVPKRGATGVLSASSTAAPCEPSSGRTSCSPSHARHASGVRPSSGRDEALRRARGGIPRPSDAEAEGTGLAGHAAAVDRRVDVVALGDVGDPERLGGVLTEGRRREVILEGALVDRDRALTLTDPDSGDRRLPTAGRLGEGVRLETP